MERVRAGQRFSSMSARLDDLLEQANLVVGVERMVKSGLRPASSAWAAEDAGAAMAWKVPSQRPAAERPIRRSHAADHLARRLVGEGDREHLPRLGAAGGEDVGRGAW